jgi:hypothetical protein
MREIFVGSEAVASRRLSEYELRRWYRPVYRDVYMPKSVEPSLRDRAECAWLWSKGRAVIAGVAAAALHGAQWVDADHPIELIAPNSRPQKGLIVRNESLADGEITRVAGLPVTSPARTAFDLSRHLTTDDAVARIDALMRAISFLSTMCCWWRESTRVLVAFAASERFSPWWTRAPHHQRRPGCDDCCSAPTFRHRPRRYR